jgi:hypothetical protein
VGLSLFLAIGVLVVATWSKVGVLVPADKQAEPDAAVVEATRNEHFGVD